MTTRKLLANLGDQCWTEHGGFLVFEKDEHNQSYVDIVDTWRIDCGDCEDENDPKMLWDVYSFQLEKVTSDTQDWYKVREAAQSWDFEESELWKLLGSDDPVKLASGYQVLVSYHGAIEFDWAPCTLNYEGMQKRYGKLLDE